jgi:hypothetical protein
MRDLFALILTAGFLSGQAPTTGSLTVRVTDRSRILDFRGIELGRWL